MSDSASTDDGGIPDRGPAVFAVTTATLVLATVFVAARIVSRAFIVRNVTWDDRVMILAWLFAFFLSFTICFGVHNGLGRHDEHIDPQRLPALRRCEYVFSILYNPALMATKTSVLIFYLRLAKHTQRVLRFASWLTLAIVNIAGVILTFMNVFQCRPTQAAWDVKYDERPTITAPTSTTSDPQSRFGGQTDFAWNASRSLMWSAVEVNVGMMCACVPTLKPLVLKLLPAMLYDPDGTRASTPKGPNDSDSPSTGHRASIQQPPPVAQPNAQSPLNANAPMSAMEFLTTPFDEPAPVRPAQRAAQSNGTYQTSTTMTSSTGTVEGVYFGFVNMTRPKSMLKCNKKESFKYCTIVSILFLLWGISYGLLNTLNNVIATVDNMTTAETLGMTSIYFGGGYFFGPLLVGEWILRRDEHNRSKRHKANGHDSVGGFKVTFIVGLCFYGIGTVIFWPSAVTQSYAGFMLSNFVVGFGLSILEVGANAFLILCGPPEYGETRVLLAQGIQGTGSVLSGLLAQKVFFKGIVEQNNATSMTLINVQWTYLGITLLCVALGLFFYYMPLPEVSDRELEQSATHLPMDPQKKRNGLQLRTWSLILAVLAQYTYVAAQECSSIYFRSLMISILPNAPTTGESAAEGASDTPNPDKPPGISLSIPDYLLIAHTAFAVSRFMAAGLTYLSVYRSRFPRPRTILTACIAGCFLFALLPVVVRPHNPNFLVIPIVLFYFFEGPIYPLVFAIGLRGQGRRTKRAAAFITMGSSGPGFFPFVMYGIIKHGGTVKTAFIVVVVLQAVAMSYSIFLQSVGDVKQMVDPCPAVRDALGQPDEEMPSPMETVIADRAGRHSTARAKSPGLFGKVSQGTKVIGAKFLSSRRRSSQPSIQQCEDSRDNTPL
ncbi:hypothetical protein ACLX1H_007399 [Fusarium chlamydosporum]